MKADDLYSAIKSGVAIAKNTSIVTRIYDAAKAANEEERKKRNSFPLRPSSALKSARDLYYALDDWKTPGSVHVDPIEGRACILLAHGHAIEAHYVTQIKRVLEVTHTNERVTYGRIDEHELNGEFDFAFKAPDGRMFIGDSKSSSEFAFKKGDLPKLEHVAQINLYLHSPWARERNINDAAIFYYNKNTSDLAVHQFQYNAELAVSTLSRFEAIYRAWESRKLPPREYVLGLDWQATYSSFKTHDSREFAAPIEERPHITDITIDAGDIKGATRKIATCHGNALVTTRGGIVCYLQVDPGVTKLILKAL